MAEVPVLQEQQTGRSPWMAEVPVLQEQQTGRLLFSDSLLLPIETGTEKA